MLDATLAQLLSEIFRLTQENDALRARIKELEAAVAALAKAAAD